MKKKSKKKKVKNQSINHIHQEGEKKHKKNKPQKCGLLSASLILDSLPGSIYPKASGPLVVTTNPGIAHRW